MQVKIKKLCPEAVIPTRGSSSAAGYDLYALGPEVAKSFFIPAHQTIMVKTGLAVEIPEGYCGLVFARSGMASKRGLAPANKVGVIDSDYRGEIMVALHNHYNKDLWVSDHERIAQLVIVPYLNVDFVESEELDETERGAGGFGSTGK